MKVFTLLWNNQITPKKAAESFAEFAIREPMRLPELRDAPRIKHGCCSGDDPAFSGAIACEVCAFVDRSHTEALRDLGEAKRKLEEAESLRVAQIAAMNELSALTERIQAECRATVAAELEAEDKASLQLIQERDEASDAFDRLAALLDVETEYSNERGFEEIIEDCEAAINSGVGKDWIKEHGDPRTVAADLATSQQRLEQSETTRALWHMNTQALAEQKEQIVAELAIAREKIEGLEKERDSYRKAAIFNGQPKIRHMAVYVEYQPSPSGKTQMQCVICGRITAGLERECWTVQMAHDAALTNAPKDPA